MNPVRVADIGYWLKFRWPSAWPNLSDMGDDDIQQFDRLTRPALYHVRARCAANGEPTQTALLG